MAKIDFQVQTQYGAVADAIWFPDDAPMTDEEIEAEKQRRVDEFIARIENNPAPEA
jgi:hypothetical protein